MPGLPRLDLAATDGKGVGRGGRATVRHLRVIMSLSVCLCVAIIDDPKFGVAKWPL